MPDDDEERLRLIRNLARTLADDGLPPRAIRAATAEGIDASRRRRLGGRTPDRPEAKESA